MYKVPSKSSHFSLFVHVKHGTIKYIHKEVIFRTIHYTVYIFHDGHGRPDATFGVRKGLIQYRALTPFWDRQSNKLGNA